MSYVFAILLTVAAFAYIAYPFLRGPRRVVADAGNEEVDGLLTRGVPAYSMLKELESDYESGILTEEDYQIRSQTPTP